MDKISILIVENFKLIAMDIQPQGRHDILDEAERICNEFSVPIIFFTTEAVDSTEIYRLENRCVFHPIPFMKEELVRDIRKLLQDKSITQN